MKSLITILTIFFSLSTFAEYQKILEIINTENNEPATLSVQLNNNLLTGLKLETLRRTSIYDYEEVKRGTPLLKKSGISIVAASAPHISPYLGGDIILTYLKNFNLLGSTYGKIDLKIKKVNKQWSLFKNEKLTNKLFLTPHPYGIESYKFE